MPKPIKSQKEHDRRFNADKESFRQKYGRMSLEEIAGCGKVRGCTVEYRRECAKDGLRTHKELYKIKNSGKSLEEIATSSKRILSRDKWGRKMSNLFEKKDVYSWSNLEEAKKYIGDEGYFCDTYHESLDAWYKGILKDVDQSMPVDCIFEDEETEVFGLFLPADKVKQSE